jgi:FixJ family two-component response regulator
MSNAQIIVIIDDDDLIRESMQSLLESLGYASETFASAEEYVRSDHVRDTACLIVDVQMPGMTGFDLQDWMISNQYCTPIIFMSGLSTAAVKVRAKATIGTGFLDKPVNVARLEEYLKRALNGSGRPPDD